MTMRHLKNTLSTINTELQILHSRISWKGVDLGDVHMAQKVEEGNVATESARDGTGDSGGLETVAPTLITSQYVKIKSQWNGVVPDASQWSGA